MEIGSLKMEWQCNLLLHSIVEGGIKVEIEETDVELKVKY